MAGAGWSSPGRRGIPKVVGRRTIALGLVLAAAACHRGPGGSRGPASDASEGEPWPELPSEGFVLVLPNSLVYLQPDATGPWVRMGWPREVPEPWPTGGTVARVTGMRDGFVEIAPLLHPHDFHCEGVLEGETFDVRLYVSPWSLGPVVTRAVSSEFEDGTSIGVGPGTPVRALPDGRWAATANDVRLQLELPEDAVGLVYPSPGPSFETGGRMWQGPVGAPPPVFDGDQPLHVVSRFGSSQAMVTESTPLDEGFRVGLATRCVRATVISEGPPADRDEDFVFFEFGLGAPSLAAVPPGSAALDVATLLGPEPEVPEKVEIEFDPDVFGTGRVDDGLGMLSGEEGLFEEELLAEVPLEEVPFDDIAVLQEQLPASGLLGGSVDGTQIFEAGAPLYFGAEGPPVGELHALQPLREGWVMGERVCFPTSFGASFVPLLPVCFDGGEGRLQTPETVADDSSMAVVTPGEVTHSGTFEPGAVERALRRSRHHLRRCYQHVLRQQGAHPRGEGLALVLEVAGDGTVTHAQSVDPASGPILQCVTKSAESWEMPPTTDGEPGWVELRATVGRP